MPRVPPVTRAVRVVVTVSVTAAAGRRAPVLSPGLERLDERPARRLGRARVGAVQGRRDPVGLPGRDAGAVRFAVGGLAPRTVAGPHSNDLPGTGPPLEFTDGASA